MAGFNKDFFNEDLNERLQGPSGGVDFMALKTKYAKIKQQQEASGASKQVHQMEALHQNLNAEVSGGGSETHLVGDAG